MPATPSNRSRTVLVANPSADLYGSDRMMVEAVAGLVERGWRTVVVVSRTGPLVELLEEVGAEVSVCPAPVVRKANLTPKGMVDLLGDIRRGLPAMRALLRSVRPDVVYVSTVTVPFWLLVARWARVPVAVHVHEAEASVPALARWGLAAPNLLADRVIYNSRTSEGVGRSVPFHRDTATVVYNGVRGPAEVTPPRDDVVDPRLLFVGRLSPRKGVDVAIRALALLHERGLRAKLTVVGAVFPGYEWFEEELRELVESEGLGGSVEFTGFLSDVWGALADSDIVLVPSRGEESFGNAVIEGLLAARPVVVSDHTGLREAREGLEAAVPVPPDDPLAIANAVQHIVQEWSSYRVSALSDAGEAACRHSLARYRSEVEAVLSELVVRG